MKKTLVLFAHPYFEHSSFNVKLIDFYKNREDVHFRDLYEEYPDFHIAAFRERKRLSNYDQFIFHFPIIWLGIPPLLKLWMNEVLDMRWLQKNAKNPIKGKKALILISAGGSEQSYLPEGQYSNSAEDFSLSLTRSLEVCGVEIVEIISIYSARHKNTSKINDVKIRLNHYLI